MTIFALGAGISSCKKFIEIPDAPNLISTTQVFADSSDATAALLSLYVSIMGASSGINAYDGTITVYTGLAGDELITNTGISDEQAIYQNNVLPTNQTVYGIWYTTYPTIYEANAVISAVSSSSGISNSTKNQLIGEAKFVRAFCYFQLVNLYGAVPLALTTNYQTNASLARSSTDSVYREIIADLTDAQTLLTPTYPSTGRVRPNEYTATALLSKVYLYQQQWSKAAAAASQIINSGLYSLSSLNNIFLSTINTPANEEPIWQLMPVQVGYETAEGTAFVPTSNATVPNYILTSYLLNAFEPGDLRKGNPSSPLTTTWLNTQVIGTTTYWYPYKYKLGHDNKSSPSECYNVFRLAEQYLIRAEAEAEQGDSADAIVDLDVIRTRAGLPNYSPVSQGPLLSTIYHERQVELFCEWGNRWYDLKRTSLINSVMGSPGSVCAEKGGTWNPYDQLFPINSFDILSDPYLVQNPGYN